jgi:hypothetical protein
MISVVHFALLSLIYELWAIFQNFSQGGSLSHLQGLGDCSRAPGGWGGRLSASNEPDDNPNKHLELHATFIAVLGRLCRP